ncbi:MAG TPA: hypothetical protein VMW16_03320 [Sedimentisphaerales bacterium]|nr:hypothetical protein [Sedimentisphaerales bacterium]
MEYLCEEVERALKTVLPDERNEFLKRLTERFPAGNVIIQPMIKEQEVSSDSAVEAGKLKDADFLVRSLLEVAPTLSSEQKESIRTRLQQAGLAPQGAKGPDYSGESLERLMAELQLSGGPPPDADRLTELAALLADFVWKLEPLVWNTWRRLSPRSGIRPSGELKKTVGQFICSDSAVSREQVDNGLKELQRLTAAVITAISRVGGQFAKQHLAKFSPSEISALVRMEHRSVLVSQDVKCWRKYLELADALNEDAIETEIRKAIVDYVESLVRKMS